MCDVKIRYGRSVLAFLRAYVLVEIVVVSKNCVAECPRVNASKLRN